MFGTLRSFAPADLSPGGPNPLIPVADLLIHLAQNGQERGHLRADPPEERQAQDTATQSSAVPVGNSPALLPPS